MNCLYCDKPIEGKRNTKKYCNSTCKQYAYLHRSFGMPSDLNSPSLITDEIKNDLREKGIETNISANENQNPGSIIKTLMIPPDLRKQITEQEYQYIYPGIFKKIQDGYFYPNIDGIYFTNKVNYGGRINQNNFGAFTYILPRLRCLIENLFQLSHKKSIYYRTAITICGAVKEMLLSEHRRLLPVDFPFFEDLIKIHEQFDSIADYLKGNKEGIKFRLNKTAIARYLTILILIRERTEKLPFNILFPELVKIKPV